MIQDSFTGSNVKDLKELATALSDFSQGNYGGALDVLLKQAETYPELYMYIGTCYAVTDESDKMFESYENMSRHLDSTRMYMPCTVHII